MPFLTATIRTCIAIFPKTTKTIFTATGRADAALAISTRCFSTLLTAVFAASGTSAIMIRIRAVGINQEQPIDQRTAASRTQNGNNKQTGRKMSHSFNIPSVVNYLALYGATHHVPQQTAKTISCRYVSVETVQPVKKTLRSFALFAKTSFLANFEHQNSRAPGSIRLVLLDSLQAFRHQQSCSISRKYFVRQTRNCSKALVYRATHGQHLAHSPGHNLDQDCHSL